MMNSIYHSIWNPRTATCVAVSEHARGAGKTARAGTSVGATGLRARLTVMATAVLLATCGSALAVPSGAVVTNGAANVVSTPGAMTINQASTNLTMNWQSFDIARGETVRFNQPSSSAVALNRVLGPNPSNIFGSLSSNGKVFLINPNGILFGAGSSVNVGSLVASTLPINDADFAANQFKFGTANNGGTATVQNLGSINAASGYVALLGNNVTNNGVIAARLGTVALAGGSAVTLDLAGDRLLNVSVDRGAVNALVQNGGLIQADGGQVLLTTQAAGNLLATAINNTGVIQAQTIQNIGGTIKLMGDMQGGAVSVNGTLDVSAPNGGSGGFIETSASRVKVKDGARVTTVAANGRNGNWLIDPQNFTIGSNAGDNISGSTLSNELVTSSVTISTALGSDALTAGAPPLQTHFAKTVPTGNGDINVNDAVTWTASSNPTTLTLLAQGDVNINQAISATKGNLVVCCGNDVNVKAALTTVDGSILLNAGHNANINAAMSTTRGNVEICAANDITVGAAITLTNGSLIPAQSLNLPLGLTFNAGYGGTGPGTTGGTLIVTPLAPKITVTGPNAPATINYNPVSYTTPTDYLPNFTLTGGATLAQHMLVFPGGADRSFDGTTVATLAGLKGNPLGVTLIAGPGSSAAYTSPDVGVNKAITFTGYSLGGTNANAYALPTSCCTPILGRTSGTVTAAILPPPPVVTPPTPPLPVAPPLPVIAPPSGVLAPGVMPPVEVAPPALIAPPLAGPPLVVVPPPAFGPPVVLLPPPEAPPVTIVPPEVPPAYVPPVHPRKQDRH